MRILLLLVAHRLFSKVYNVVQPTAHTDNSVGCAAVIMSLSD